MTLAKQLSHEALDRLVQRHKMREVTTADGGPYLPLVGPASPHPVGVCRIFSGVSVHRLVYIAVGVPQIGMDSHMFFAFTPPGSAVPHFTLDSVMAGPSHAFHLDLIPRVDLGANLAYMNETLLPLSASFDAARKIEGLTPANLSPRQYALMSPWMLAFRATEAAYAACRPHIHAYLDHWSKLVESGVPAPAGVTPAQLAARDQANRDAIFSYEVDPVWNMIERLLGKPLNERLIGILRQQDIES